MIQVGSLPWKKSHFNDKADALSLVVANRWGEIPRRYLTFAPVLNSLPHLEKLLPSMRRRATNPDIGGATTYYLDNRGALRWAAGLHRLGQNAGSCLICGALQLQLGNISGSWLTTSGCGRREGEQDALLLPLVGQHHSDMPAAGRITKSHSAHQTTNQSPCDNRNCYSQRAK